VNSADHGGSGRDYTLAYRWMSPCNSAIAMQLKYGLPLVLTEVGQWIVLELRLERTGR